MNNKEEVQAKLNDKKTELEKLEKLMSDPKNYEMSPAQVMPKIMSYYIGGLGIMGFIITAISAIFAPITIPLLIGSGVFLATGVTLFAVGEHIERNFHSRKYRLKNDIFALQREIDTLSAELGKEDSNSFLKQDEKIILSTFVPEGQNKDKAKYDIGKE